MLQEIQALPEQQQAEVLAFARFLKIGLSDEQGIEIAKDDPDDNKFLAVALAGKADFIVSGDQHLLKIGSFQQIEIINARAFLHRIELA